jgi:tRNA-specific 2-thiouridylase
MEGDKIGEHTGYANYTIGQRRGMGISSEDPLYVVRIDTENNSIIAGGKDDLLANEFRVVDTNWLVSDEEIPERITAKIRYRHPAAPAKLYLCDDKATVEFDEPQRAITPGQSAAFYDDDILIGGGVISGTVD